MADISSGRAGGGSFALFTAVGLTACVAPVDLGGGLSSKSAPTSPTPTATALPPVPGTLTNVVTTVTGDSVGIDFDPVDDAVDYRVYPLPADRDVTVHADQSVTIRSGIYRCAGARQTFDLANNLNKADTGLFRTRGEFSWTATVPDDPTLGYVYVTPGEGKTPVYALGGLPSNDEAGWRESRTKIYAFDGKERTLLLQEGWRDDGVVFYVPSAATAETRTVYHSVGHQDLGGGAFSERQNYFDDAGTSAHASDFVPPTVAFRILTAPPPGSAASEVKPLMVVGYDTGHDELAVGKERFARAAHQGKGPLWHLEWSGLTGPTTLVIEALDSGCPYQGLLSPSHLSAPPHQTFSTLEDLRQTSPTSEVFVNGQFDVTTLPRAIARTLVTVSPAASASADWDWNESFDGTGALANATDSPASGCFNCVRQRTSKFDVTFDRLDRVNDAPVLAYGEVLGQLFLDYDDDAGGTIAVGQFTALQKAQIDPDSSRFLHVAFSANSAATLRRYPQLIVSDQDAPLFEALKNPDNDTLIFEPRGGPEISVLLAAIHGLVNGNPWAPDLPGAPIHTVNGPPPVGAPFPFEPPFEHVGIDRMTRFDVYISSARFYVLMDGAPAGCTVLPPEVVLRGPVTVTFGDVFFDEAAEPDVCVAERPYDFLHRHQCRETSRRLDELGFKSGTALPAWDEARFPCTPYAPDP
jgi:hypothetical protein